MEKLLYEEESYQIIGCCMEAHRLLGRGHHEVIYKDALEFEFGLNKIPFEREKPFKIQYKTTILPRSYKADFVVFGRILLEIKAIECLIKSNVKQTLNYLAATKLRLGLLVNFGEDSLAFQRIVL